MARQFSIPAILRMAPKELLQQCFQDLGHDDTRIHWKWLREKEIEPIVEYLNALAPDERDKVEGVLRSIFELSNDDGYVAILEAAPHCAVYDLPALIADDLSICGRVIWVWIHQRAIFERAQFIFQVAHMSLWRTRKDLPKQDPDMSASAKGGLAADVSLLFKDQGRGKTCSVEIVSRGDVDFFFVYPDDFVKSVTVHDKEGKLTDETIRQTFLVVFAYDRTRGTLGMFAKLPKREKERLEWIFAKNVLAFDLPKHEPDPAFELEHLKDPAFELAIDPSDRLRVSIRKMTLIPPGGGRIQVEVDEGKLIHEAIHDYLNLEEVPLDRWGVAHVTFSFEALEKLGRKAFRQSVEIGYPRSGGVKGMRAERAEIIQKYLNRWGIDCVDDTEEDLVEVGVQPTDHQPSGNGQHLSASV
jgi:hypothetical protein